MLSGAPRCPLSAPRPKGAPWPCPARWGSCSCTGCCSVPTCWATTRPSSSKEGTTCSSCARRARRSSWRSWRWWAWPPNRCTSAACRRHCESGRPTRGSSASRCRPCPSAASRSSSCPTGAGANRSATGTPAPARLRGKGGEARGRPPPAAPRSPRRSCRRRGCRRGRVGAPPNRRAVGMRSRALLPSRRGAPSRPSGSDALEPELVRTVAESVERLLQSCPRGGDAELRALLKLNKKLAKAVGHIFQLEDGDRQKEEEIRRHSAIYGRGDARRREGKQLTLHELIINEAAAQFCLRDNSLLLRRVELFSLSRQVARESTYLSSLKVSRAQPEDGGASAAKRLKQEVGEQSRPDPPPLGSDLHAPPYRVGNEEDAGGAAGESPDGHAQEFEDGLAERGPPVPPDPPRGTIKVEQENSRQ
uniref:NGFI-A binding protein 2 n=1 Tax=Gallus gallus TaxID=9031 RepID=A0A8V1A2H9_CHICK